MITDDDLRIHGLGIQWAGAAVQLSYLYPGALTSRLDDPRSATQQIVLGLSTADPDSQDVLDEKFWRWPPTTSPATQIWLRHAYAAHVRQQALIYEIDGEVVLVWSKIPPLAFELELLDEGFSPALATWRAPATIQTRATARRLATATLPAANAIHIADILEPTEHADRSEHAWLRWFTRFDDRVVKVGDRTYDLRAARHPRDTKFTLDYHRRGSELRFEFDISRHPLVHDVKVGIRDAGHDWATTQINNVSWSTVNSLITEAAQLIAKSTEPAPTPTDERLPVWESTFASTLAEFELPASKPLYALAHRMAIAGIAAADVLTNKHGAKLTEALRVGGRKHEAMIRSLQQSLMRAFAEAPSEAARWELISVTQTLLEKTGRVSPPGPASEEFWRTWKAPDVLVLARRRYQLRPHEVHFGRSTLNLRYGAGPGGDTPSLAVLRLQINLPDRHGRPTLIVTHLDGKRAVLQQTAPWALTVPELEALTGDQIAARLNPIHNSTATLNEITWEEALIAEFEAQDPRDPQLRLERRLGSGLSIFAAYLPGPAPTPVFARVTINDTFEIEELTPEAERPLDELIALRARLEAALAVVARDFRDDESTVPKPDFHAARRTAVQEPPPKQLIDRLATQLDAQREEATLAALRTQARTDLGAASRTVAALALPPGPSPSEIVTWLSEHDLEKSAALISAYIFEPAISLTEFAADLATALDAELGARRMRATKPPQVPRTALRQDAQERTYILEATGPGVRQHFVNELPDQSDSRFVALGPPRLLAAMQPTPRVYADDLVKDTTLTETWRHFDTLIRSLADAPAQLAEVRQLLVAAAVLADSPKCQGQAKENALLALTRARDAHEAARQQLHRGRDARAVDRLQQALRQIAEVAHQTAKSCGAGQGALLRDEFQLPTLPETAANMNGEV